VRRISHAPCRASSCQNSPAFGVFSVAPPHLTSAAASNGGPYTCRGVRGVPELQPARGLPAISPAIVAVDGGRGAGSRPPGRPAHLHTLCCMRRPQVSITKHLQQAPHGSTMTEQLIRCLAIRRVLAVHHAVCYLPSLQHNSAFATAAGTMQTSRTTSETTMCVESQCRCLHYSCAMRCSALACQYMLGEAGWRIVCACFISCRALRNV